MNIVKSVEAYEAWLRAQLGVEFEETNVEDKHQRMAEGPFPFLRATYWRWAEIVLDVCPELAKAPPVLAVGDIHLENYGTWRDADGRLVWGVNDFDEAAEMPYAIDLVRLATSAILAAGEDGCKPHDITAPLLQGYAAGVGRPQPIVLDRDHAWLRAVVEVKDKARKKFWKKLKKLEPGGAPARPRYVRALKAAMPEPSIRQKLFRREAGLGSLGRPRWVAIGTWRGAPVVREAKVLVPSAWTLTEGRGGFAIRWNEIATGPHRAPDPWFRLTDNIVVRRLSPNNRKIESDKKSDLVALLDPRMLHAMGHELASIHLGSANGKGAIEMHLAHHKTGWFLAAIDRAVHAMARDYGAWKRHMGATAAK